MTFYIFRHAETPRTKYNIPYGDENETVQILPEEVKVIKRIANYLKNVKTDANFTSPYKRCTQTADIVSEITGKKFIKDNLVGEYRDDLGESFSKMKKRFRKFLEEMSIENYQNIAVCTHGAGLSALKYLILGKTYDESKLMDFPKPGVLMIISKKGFKEIDFN